VAELRGKSEEYVDFYLSGGEGTIAAEVATELARIGWVPDPS
jgi:hypothetical protein